MVEAATGILRELQLTEAEMLSQIKRICEKYGLTYYLVYGTLLGAVRHQGFIPWDDDIDIGMLREDYEKFLKIAPQCLKKGYTLQHFSTDKNTPTYFAKIRKDGTQFVEYSNKSLDIHHGIFVDIFPYDKVPNEKGKQKKHWNKIRRQNIPYQSKVTCTPLNPLFGNPIKAFLLRILFTLFHILLLPVKRKVFFDLLDNTIKAYNHTSSTLVTSIGQLQGVADVSSLFPVKKHSFENITVNIPADAHGILTNEFGDYMQLPPEDKQLSHAPYLLKF